MLVQILSKLNLAKDVHAQDGVHEAQQEQERTDVDQARDRDQQRVEQHSQTLELSDEPEDPRQTKHAQHGSRAAATQGPAKNGDEDAEKVKAVPLVGEVHVGIHGVQLHGRLADEYRPKDVTHHLERVGPGLRLIVIFARHHHRVEQDDEHDEVFERLLLHEFVQRFPIGIGRVILLDCFAQELSLALHPQLLLLCHRRRAAVAGFLADLRKVIQDDTDEEVEDEEVGDDHERQEEEREGRGVIPLGRKVGRPRIDAHVHHRGPTLRCGHLEQGLHGVEHVVKVHVLGFPHAQPVIIRVIRADAKTFRGNAPVVAARRDRVPGSIDTRDVVPAVDASRLGLDIVVIRQRARLVVVVALRKSSHEELHAENAEDEPEQQRHQEHVPEAR